MKNAQMFRPRSCAFALEPRVLFDGAAAVDVVDHYAADCNQSTPETGERSLPDSSTAEAMVTTLAPTTSAATVLFVVDARVTDHERLLADLPADVTVVTVDPGQSGLAVVTSALDQIGQVDSIQIVSHGSSGCFSLGSDQIDLASLGSASELLQQWGVHLSADADILLYGCEIGSGPAGDALLHQLAAITGADVAASVDTTGAATLGGDWTLEASVGAIDSALALDATARDGYQHLLAAPSITDAVTTPRTISEDLPLTISGLSVADADDDQLSLTLSSTTGTLRLADLTNLTAVSGNGTGELRFTGLAADVNTALAQLDFQGLSNASGATSFVIEVSDGVSTASRTVDIVISPVNDAPTLAGASPLSVAEGGTAAFHSAVNLSGSGFSQSDLGLVDTDNSQNQVIIKIAALPNQGTLKLSGVELSVGSTFAVSQISNLTYSHNGAQSLGVSTDAFNVTIDDGAGGLVVDQTVSVNITPVNQAPIVIGTVTVIEGEQNVSLTDNGALALPSPIARGAIAVSDPDDASFTYAVVSLPSHGALSYNGVAIAAASLASPFVVADLGLLAYSHDGSEPNGTPDSFQLQVTDAGGGAATPLTTVSTVAINVLGNNDDPVLTVDVGQALNAGQSALTLTSTMLQVTDIDSAVENLTYTVVSAPDPSLGYFTLNGLRLVTGSSFTQADIDAGLVGYVNRSGTAHTDTLAFTVKDGERRLYPTPRDGGIYAASTDVLAVNTFTITVPENATVDGSGVPGPVAGNSTPTVGGDNSASLLEGESVTLTAADLIATDDAPASQLTYRLLTVPTSGTLTLNGIALGYYDSFTQADVNAALVRFVHAGGEDFNDGFAYSVSDGVSESGVQQFTLTITPQNDSPTARVGTRAFGPEGSSITLSSAHILLADTDNSTSDNESGYAVNNSLSFRITGNVSHGVLRLNGSPITVGDVVTAADLAAGHLIYTHDGSENRSDAFTLVPLDNAGVATTVGLNQSSEGAELTVPITLTPINDAPTYAGKQQLVSGEAGAVLEGSTTIIWGAQNYPDLNGVDGAGSPTLRSSDAYLVFADSDNTTEQRQYRVTTAPANGSLLLSGVVLSVGSVFTQDDLDSGRISYRHNGSETNSDFFDYVVSDGDFTANDAGAVAQGSVATPSRFSIAILPANDAPSLTAAASSLVVDSAITPVSLPHITLADLDISSGIGSGEQNFLQVRVEFLDAGGAAFTDGVLSFNGALPAGVGVIDAVDDHLVVFQGTMADVQSALDLLQARLASGVDADAADLQIKISVDDRLRDVSGALTSGANGGPVNADGSAMDDAHNIASLSITVAASSVNDPPVITNTAPTPSIAEDVRTAVAGLSVSDVDAFTAATNTLTITAAHQGHLYFAASGTATPTGLTVTAGAIGSSSVTLQGSMADLNAALASLYYQSAGNYNGSDQLTITVDDHGSTGRDGGSSTAVAIVDIALIPVNDSPTLSMPSGTRYLTSGGSFVFSGSDSLSFNDAADISSTITGFDADADVYTLTLSATLGGTGYGAVSAGTVTGLTVSGNGSSQLVLTGNRADLTAALATVSYQPTDTNVNGAVNFQMVVDDLGNGGTAIGGSGGSRTASESFTLMVTSANETPGFTNLAATAASTYTENGAAVVIDADAGLSDAELDLYSSWNGATLTIQRQGTAAAEDVFGLTGSGSTGINFNGTSIRSGTTVIGSCTNSGGVLSITFNTAADAAIVDSVVRALTYRNSSEAPPASVTLSYEINDQNVNIAGGGIAGSGQDQGDGGRLIAAHTVEMNITRVIDNPTLSSGAAISYTENAVPSTVDAGLTLADLDDAQMNSATISISSGFVAGDLLAVDLSGTGITTSYDAATGVLSLNGVDTVAHYQQVLRSLSFASSSDDPTVDHSHTSRTLSYALSDNGSSGGGTGVGTTTRIVSVSAINDAPVLSGAESTRIFTENDAPLLLEPSGFGLSDADDVQMSWASAQIINGLSAGDVLSAAVLPTGWSQSYNAATGMLTLSGPAAAASEVIAALQSVSYVTASEDPATVERQIRWQVQDANSDQAVNGQQLSNTLITRLDVVNVPDRPVAVDDSATVNEGSLGVSGDVTPGTAGQDSDLDNTNAELMVIGIRAGAESETGSMSTIAGGTTGSDGTLADGLYGSLRIGADGSWNYSLDNDNAAVNGLKAGQTLSERFTYRLSDPGGLDDTAQLTIVINGATDGAPTITTVDGNGAASGEATVFEAGLESPADASESATGRIDLSAADGLLNVSVGGRTLSLAELNTLAANPVTIATAEGSITLTGFTPGTVVDGTPLDGQLSYVYTLVRAQSTPSADASTETVALAVTDAGGATTSGVLTLRLVDDTPTAVDDANAVDEGIDGAATSVVGNVFANGAASDRADRLGADQRLLPVVGVAFAATTGSIGSPLNSNYGSLQLDADGGYLYTPDNDNPVVEALRPSQTLTEVFAYQLVDADGDLSQAALTITIQGQNDSPRAANDGPYAAEEDQPLERVVVLDNDSDPESDPLSVIAATVDPSQGTVTINIDGTLRFSPASDFHGTATINYVLSDGAGGTSTALVTVEVAPINDPPIAIDDHGASPDGRSVSISLLANDSDVDGDPLQVTHAAGVALRPGQSVVIAQGRLTLGDGGVVAFAPNPGVQGTVTFGYTITDGAGGVAEGLVTVEVVPEAILQSPDDPTPPIDGRPLFGEQEHEPHIWFAGELQREIVRQPLGMDAAAYVLGAVEHSQAERAESDFRAVSDPETTRGVELHIGSLGAGLGMTPTVYVTPAVHASQAQASLLDQVVSGRRARVSLSSDRLIPTPDLGEVDAQAIVSLRPLVVEPASERQPAPPSAPHDQPAQTPHTAPLAWRGALSFADQLRATGDQRPLNGRPAPAVPVIR